VIDDQQSAAVLERLQRKVVQGVVVEADLQRLIRGRVRGILEEHRGAGEQRCAPRGQHLPRVPRRDNDGVVAARGYLQEAEAHLRPASHAVSLGSQWRGESSTEKTCRRRRRDRPAEEAATADPPVDHLLNVGIPGSIRPALVLVPQSCCCLYVLCHPHSSVVNVVEFRRYGRGTTRSRRRRNMGAKSWIAKSPCALGRMQSIRRRGARVPTAAA
jgi:hypothetical protein